MEINRKRITVNDIKALKKVLDKQKIEPREIIHNQLFYKPMEKELEILKQIAETTEKMRSFQKAFFKNKNSSDLNYAKDYERRVDKLLLELKELSNPQVKMFD